MKPSHFSIPFRIRIGVTGHRQLPDVERLSGKISQVLRKDIFDLFDEKSKKLIRSSPYTPIAFSILTPLAEGADRLVAKEVLKLPDSRIEVVLPLTKEDYLQDFESQESHHEFEALLSKARRPITLKKRSLRGKFSEDDVRESRRQAYEDVGRYVVNHCDVLIALWDGEASRGKGGTAEIVKYAMEKKRSVIIISTIPPCDITIEKGHGLNAESVRNIEMFNTLEIPERVEQKYTQNMYNDLFDNPKKPEGKKLPEEAKKLVREKLLPFYVRASMIAKSNQSLYRHVGSLIYIFSAAAIASVAFGIILFHRLAPYAFFLEFLLLATILILVAFANRRRAHKKWIESRYLAERIRSAIFFAICGVEASPIHVPPYMGIAHQPDDWMVKIFDEIWNRLPEMKGCHREYCQQCSEFIRKGWIQDQIEYHKDKATKVKKWSQYLEWSGMGIFFITMVIAISHWLFFTDHKLQLSKLSNLLTFLAIVLPATGAAIGGIRSHREYSRLEKRSKNMEVVLTDLDKQFSKVSTSEALEALLRRTEELMLRETQDWLMLMRFVELKPPA